MTRGRGLIVSGVATVVLLLAMSPSDGRMKDAGGPGIVPFELSGGQDRADEIIGEWGEKGQDAARESLWIDFAFPLLATIFAACKFAFLAAAIAYLVAGLAMRLRGRDPATTP